MERKCVLIVLISLVLVQIAASRGWAEPPGPPVVPAGGELATVVSVVAIAVCGIWRIRR